MHFLSVDDVIQINRAHIAEADENIPPERLVLNIGSLEWALNIIQTEMFGVDPYPTLAEKASLIAWTIIRKHVFHQAAKRTGWFAMMEFLALNGYQLNASEDEMKAIALQVEGHSERGSISWESFKDWVYERMIPYEPF